MNMVSDFANLFKKDNKSACASRKVSDNMTDEDSELSAREKKRMELVVSNSNSISFSNSSSSSNSNSSQKGQELSTPSKNLTMKKLSAAGKTRKGLFSEIMVQRWKIESASIPHQDKLDIMSGKLNQRMQLCPEYTQEIYLHMKL
jgi:hypothetical protein